METNPLHIYFKTDRETERVLKDASSYEKYIILSNETLQADNISLQKKCDELKNQIDKLEDENSQGENTIRYMRGFLKNVLIIDQLHVKVADEYKSMSNNSKDTVRKWQKKSLVHLRYCQVIFCLLLFILHQFNMIVTSMYEITVLVVLCSMFSFLHEKCIRDLKHQNMNMSSSVIDSCNKELFELNKGQDFLNDMVDLM
jgi:hypothetical protein